MKEEANPDTSLSPLASLYFLLLERTEAPDHGSVMTATCGGYFSALFLDIFQHFNTLIEALGDAVLHAKLFHIVDPCLHSSHLFASHLSLRRFTRNHGSQEHGQKHQMIVLNPNDVSCLDEVGDHICESDVCFAIC